jgi:hypothetical protein
MLTVIPMYRIQLASEVEAVYRSLEELAVAVQNGIICPDALIYHRKTGSWLPVEAHPHYHVARELVLPDRMRPMQVRLDHPATATPKVSGRGAGQRAKAASPPQAPEDEHSRPKHRVPPEAADRATSGPSRPNTPRSPAGSLSSVEAAEQIIATPTQPLMHGKPRTQRSGGSWLTAAAVSALATVGWLMYMSGDDGSSSPGMVIAGMKAPGANAVEPSERMSAEAGVSSDTLAVTSVEATYRDAYHQARVRFEESIGSLGFEDLFAGSRISTADSLRTARHLVEKARNIVAVYRGEEVRLDQAFDMADASIREPFSTARSVDSLFAATDSIYAILQATQGHYQLRRGRIAFEDPLVTAAYVGQAIWLEARLRDWNRNPARTPVTIRPIVAAVGRVPRSQTGF